MCASAHAPRPILPSAQSPIPTRLHCSSLTFPLLSHHPCSPYLCSALLYYSILSTSLSTASNQYPTSYHTHPTSAIISSHTLPSILPLLHSPSPLYSLARLTSHSASPHANRAPSVYLQLKHPIFILPSILILHSHKTSLRLIIPLPNTLTKHSLQRVIPHRTLPTTPTTLLLLLIPTHSHCTSLSSSLQPPVPSSLTQFRTRSIFNSFYTTHSRQLFNISTSKIISHRHPSLTPHCHYPLHSSAQLKFYFLINYNIFYFIYFLIFFFFFSGASQRRANACLGQCCQCAGSATVI